MPIDASIPLQAQSQPFTLNNVAQIMQMRQQAVQQRQAAAQNNALMSIYNDPSSLGANGMLNDQGVRKISQVSPQMGMKIRTEQATIEEKTSQSELRNTEAYGKKQTLIHDAVSPALNLYDDEISKGTPPALAQQKAQVIYNESVTGLKGSGHFSDQEQQQMPSQFDPSRARAGVLTYKDRQAEIQTAKKDDRADASAALAEKRFEEGEKNSDRRFGVEMAHLGLSEKASARAEAAAGAGDAAAGDLSPEAIKNAAARYNVDGTLPPMGMGKAGAKARNNILNEAANLNSGKSGTQQREEQLTGKASGAARVALEKTVNNIQLAEKTALGSADMVLASSKAYKRTGSPMLNEPLNLYRDRVNGDTNLQDLRTNITTFKSEYVKVMSGSGQATDSAREEADHLINLSMPHDQLTSGMNQMKKEMKGAREDAIKQARALSSDSISGKKQPDSGDLPRATNPKTGHTVVYKNGAWMDE